MKRAGVDPVYELSEQRLLLEPSPHCREPDEFRAKKEHGCGYGHRRGTQDREAPDRTQYRSGQSNRPYFVPTSVVTGTTLRKAKAIYERRFIQRFA